VVAIAIELGSCLYQRHKTETENTCLFDGLPGPTWVALFGVEMSTPTIRKMLKSWIDSYSNCTEAFYKGRGSVSCVFEGTIHLWYISHVFLNMYERSPNEFKYTGTRTTNATGAWLLGMTNASAQFEGYFTH